jgi:hypothetical protein
MGTRWRFFCGVSQEVYACDQSVDDSCGVGGFARRIEL